MEYKIKCYQLGGADMNTISSSNGYSVSSGTSKGFSGMVSGMDTEGLVQKMLSGTQTKIDRQSGKKQVSSWKQDIYRDVITKVNKFQTKFLDFTSNTNLMSNTFFNQMKSTSTSSAFRVTGSSSAISGDMQVKINELATSTRLEGRSIAASNALSGEFKADAFNARVSFNVAEVTVDGVTKPTETFNLEAADIDKLMEGGAVRKELTSGDIVSFSIGTDGNFTMYGGARVVTVRDGSPILNPDGLPMGSTTALGLEKLGLVAGRVNLPTDGTMVSKVKKDASPKIEFSLDGIKKTIEIKADETNVTLQEKLNFAFGKDTVRVNGTDLTAFSLTTAKGRKIVVGGNGSGLEAMGLKEGQSNTVGMGDTLANVLGTSVFVDGKASFLINDKFIEVSDTDTISSFMREINISDADVKIEYSELENRFVMSRNSSGAGFDLKITDNNGILKKIFGAKDSSTIADVLNPANGMYKSGINAKLTINGVVTERSSNNFTVNGINFELLSKTDKIETISTTRNTDTIFDGIKSFVEEYNALIKDLNGLVDAKEEYKEYPPLTDAQRKDMSKSEIDAWEKKAQTGLLKGDSDIGSFLSQMRLALYQKPNGAKYGLYDIGIETSKEWQERGKLTIDEDKLKKMISNDPTAIQELFTYSKTTVVNGKTVPDGPQGIATTFKAVIEKTANKSSGSPGTLVLLAGIDGTASDKNNRLSDQMNKMNEKIKALKVQYEKEKSRYWREFNNMEKVLANLSSQSGWLTQQFGQ